MKWVITCVVCVLLCLRFWDFDCCFFLSGSYSINSSDWSYARCSEVPSTFVCDLKVISDSSNARYDE